jgi:hypothetical protein
MKKLLLILGTVTFICACATSHKLNFNEDKDIVTCNNGNYTLTKNSTRDELVQNCNAIALLADPRSPGLPELEFFADHNIKVKCTIKKGKVDACYSKTE